MKFSTNTLNEIKDRIPVSQVVGKKIQLKKKGREYVGLSPFNKEKTPSFTVNDEKQFYHCFSTNNHGDIFTFFGRNVGSYTKKKLSQNPRPNTRRLFAHTIS